MRFYRALLHLFPRSFRAEYGGEMNKDFAREWQCRARRRRARTDRTTLVDVARQRHARAPRHPRAGRAIRACDRCGERPGSPSPRSSSPRSASARRRRRSRSPITCCCGRCRSGTPIASSGSPRTTPSIGYPRDGAVAAELPGLEADGTSFESIEGYGGERQARSISSGEPERIFGAIDGARRRSSCSGGRRRSGARSIDSDATARRRIRSSSAIGCGEPGLPRDPNVLGSHADARLRHARHRRRDAAGLLTSRAPTTDFWRVTTFSHARRMTTAATTTST